MPRKTALLLLALALAVAACGGGGESASSTEPGEEPSAEPTSAGEEEPQTLAAFFGWDNGDPAATEARLRDQEARVQESIRRCMAEQGFEYQPVLPPDDAFRVDATSEDHEEWVRKHGFGITTWFGNEEEFTDRAAVEWEDPNQEMLDAMSVGRQAWYEASTAPKEDGHFESDRRGPANHLRADWLRRRLRSGLRRCSATRPDQGCTTARPAFNCPSGSRRIPASWS